MEINNKTEFCNRLKEPERTLLTADAKPDGCPLAAESQRLSGMVLVTVSKRPTRVPCSVSFCKEVNSRDFLDFFAGYLSPPLGI